MAEFKSSFMGGYKKKAVDAYIEELENKNKELENNAKLNNQRLAKANKILKEYKSLKDEYEKLQSENATLENEAEKLTNIVANLEARLDKSTQQNNDHIANIGKIFYSAYESGSEIAQKAKDGTDEFLNEIAASSDSAKAEIEKAINAYSLINTDIKALLESITKNITAVSQNTDKLIEKANGVANSMKKIDTLKSENEKNAENVFKKYDEFFKEYESEKTSEAKSEPTYEPHFEPTVTKAVSESESFESEPITVEKIIFQKANEPEIVESAPVVAVEEEKPVEPTPTEQPQRQFVSQRQPAPQRQVQPEQRRAVDVIRQQMNAQKPVTPKENPQPKKAEENTPMSQNRAVMLKEVLKKFQNSENEE